MKKIITNLGKYFCLTLGIFLFASSVPAFGQKQTDAMVADMSSLDDELFRLEIEFSNLYEKLKDPKKLMENHIKQYFVTGKNRSFDREEYISRRLEGFSDDDFKKHLRSILENYTPPVEGFSNEIRYIMVLSTNASNLEQAISHYEYYLDVSNRIIERGTLEELSRRYYLKDVAMKSSNEKLFVGMLPENLLQHKDFLLPIDPETEYVLAVDEVFPQSSFREKFYMKKTDVERAKTAIKYMLDKIQEMKEGIQTINKAKAELLRQKYTPLDIMDYAYKSGMLPKGKAGLKLILNTIIEKFPPEIYDITLEYLKGRAGIKDVKYCLPESIIKDIESMSLAERTELIKVNAGKDFKNIEDLFKLRYTTVRGLWVLAALGAVATSAYITDVATNTHFDPLYTMSPSEVANIGTKIENGTASIQEKLAFFTNPSSEELVETDPVYTLSFVQLASDIYAADELLKTQETREQEVNDKINNTMLNQLEKQMERADFGVGSL